MGRKKKPKKKKIPQPSVLTAEEEAFANSILQRGDEADPAELVAEIPDSRHAQAVIERVCMDKAPSISLLLAIKDRFEDKQVQKAIKKALFKLKQRGIHVEGFSEPEGTSSPILKPPQEEKPAAYVGPILNMFGSRAVLITHQRPAKGQLIGMGLASDKEGIHEFLSGTFSKKRARELKDHLSEKAGPLVETSLPHAATILEHAYQRHVEKHPDAPSDYLELRPWLLENAPLLGHSIIYDFIGEDQIENRIMTDSQLEKLFQHKLMEAWVIEFKPLQPVMEELFKADDSPIVLSDGQKSDQARRIKEKCMDELFPDPEQALLKRRLEEMSFFFFKQEEKDFCRLCLDAAGVVGQAENLLQKNPVIEFLVERSINFYTNLIQGGASEDKEQEDDSAPSIIIP